jgi:hypothetical protein
VFHWDIFTVTGLVLLQYIIKYKGIDYNNKLNLESINNVIETLIINIKLLSVSLT